MEQLIEEYGMTAVGVFTGILVFSLTLGLIFSGGILGNLIILLGNAAC